MKKIFNIPAACAVVALHHVSGVDEETVLRVCALHGFKSGRGIEDAEWKQAARDLGLKIRAVPCKDIRLGQFIKKHPSGLFLMGTVNHLFVLDNSIVIDPREKARGRWPCLGRVIKGAWRVSRAENVTHDLYCK